MSRLSRATIAGGVLEGATRPIQASPSTLGKPNSAIVGTLGSSASRSRPVTASTLIAPVLACGAINGGASMNN